MFSGPIVESFVKGYPVADGIVTRLNAKQNNIDNIPRKLLILNLFLTIFHF
jgi:hypothetical protein